MVGAISRILLYICARNNTLQRFLVKLIHYECTLYHFVACGVERLYDLRVVWPPETAADETYHLVALVACDTLLVGYCVGRVFVPDSCQPNWFYGQRRSIYPDAAQSDAGGYHADNLYGLHHHILQGRDSAVEPLCCICLLDCSGLFCIYEVGCPHPA